MSRPPTRSTDALLESLADWRRRAVLQLLSERGGPLTLESIVESLGVGEADEVELRIQLHHRHLPFLDDAGFVNYDASTNTVRYRRDERIESLLDLLADEFE